MGTCFGEACVGNRRDMNHVFVLLVHECGGSGCL